MRIKWTFLRHKFGLRPGLRCGGFTSLPASVNNNTEDLQSIRSDCDEKVMRGLVRILTINQEDSNNNGQDRKW